MRLGLGYTAVATAFYIFYLDYVQKIKFTDIKTTTAIAVIAYFILNGLLSLWLWFGEKGLIFAGSRTDGDEKVVLKIHSHVPHRKYEPSYRLLVEWAVEGQEGKSGKKEVKAPFMMFFSEDGYFQPAEFENWVRRVIPLTKGDAASMGQETADSLAQSKATGSDADAKTLGRESVLSDETDSQMTSDSMDLGTDSAAATPRKRGRPKKGDSRKA